jgi:hypothetical protein
MRIFRGRTQPVALHQWATGALSRFAGEERVHREVGRAWETSLIDDLEVGRQDVALPRGRANVIASIMVQKERLDPARSVRVEVEDHESAPHHTGQRSQHRVRDVVGEVVQDTGHDRLVELGVGWQVLEEHALEAAIRKAPAPPREVEVVGVEIDPEVRARHDLAEPTRAAARVEDTLRRGGAERAAHLVQRAVSVQSQPSVVEKPRAQESAGHGDRCISEPAQGQLNSPACPEGLRGRKGCWLM